MCPWTVRRFTLGPLAENAYMVSSGGRGVLIDPGDEAVRFLEAAQLENVELEAILLTHAHFDHVGAVAELVEVLDLPVYLHPADLSLYTTAKEQAARFGLSVRNPPLPVQPLSEGSYTAVGPAFEVLHLPGHSPGQVGFWMRGQDLLFSGDLLFAGGIGRYDLPGADRAVLMSSIARLKSLPRDTRVLPGHGPETTLAKEFATNPFLR